jgi:hypothetical protein
MAAAAVAEGGGGKRRDGASGDCAGWQSAAPADREGVIEIAFGCGARLRLRGEVSSETLRQVIELLR